MLIDADEYASLEETAHLLSSPANVRRLLRALMELEGGRGQSYASVDELWREIEAEAAPEEMDSLPAAEDKTVRKDLERRRRSPKGR